MKIIENLTLSIDMTGAWNGNNVDVTAKIWNGKITKTGSLTGSFSIDRVTLNNMEVDKPEQARFEVVIKKTIGKSTNSFSDFYTTNVRKAMEAGWELALEHPGDAWSYDLLDYGEQKEIYVPSSTYKTFTSFKVQAPAKQRITEIGSFKNSDYFPLARTVYLYEGNTQLDYGPFVCVTREEYEQGQTDGWTAAVGQSNGTWYNQDVRAGASIKIYVPSSKPYSGSTYFTVHGTSSGGSGGGGGSCCFPAGAPVLLANGATAPIESLTLGTAVIGYDLDRQGFCDTEVMSTIQKKHRSDIYEIQREDGVSFLMTANHVVLTKNGWKAIDAERGQQAVPDEVVTELTNEDELLRSDGNYVKINNIRYRDDLQDQNVYNIDVEEVDTYIVYDIVVHNECSGGNE